MVENKRRHPYRRDVNPPLRFAVCSGIVAVYRFKKHTDHDKTSQIVTNYAHLCV